MADKLDPPELIIDEAVLANAGFSNTGALQFKKTVVDFANELSNRAKGRQRDVRELRE